MFNKLRLLRLTLNKSEQIVINNGNEMCIIALADSHRNNNVRLMFKAPDAVEIIREPKKEADVSGITSTP